MKCEGGDTVVRGANDTVPCSRACLVSSPVGEELAVCVGLLTEESKCVCVIIRETWYNVDGEKEEEEEEHDDRVHHHWMKMKLLTNNVVNVFSCFVWGLRRE